MRIFIKISADNKWIYGNWWSFRKSEENKDNSEVYIHILKIPKLKISRYTLADDLNKKILSELFPPNSVDLKGDEIVIPSKYLIKAWFLGNILQNSNFLNLNSDFINWINSTDDVSFTINSEHQYNKIKSVFPMTYTKFYYSLTNNININPLIEDGYTEEKLESIGYWNLKFCEIKLISKLSKSEHKLLWKILSSSRTKFLVSSVSVWTKNLSECLELLSVCAGCSNLSSLVLIYSKPDIPDAAKAISAALNNFICKSKGLINILEVRKASWKQF